MSKHISKIRFSNCLGLEEVEIRPEKINILSGGNHLGKSSVLESIEKAIYNNGRRTKFVKDGEDKATMYIELDDGISIARVVKADGRGSLVVKTEEGTYRAPQAVLNELVGSLAFNPIDFISKSDKEQVAMIAKLLPDSVTKDDLLDLFGEIPPVILSGSLFEIFRDIETYYYDRRKEANSAVKEVKSKIATYKSQLPDDYELEFWENVELRSFWDTVKTAQQCNSNITEAQALVDARDDMLKGLNDLSAATLATAVSNRKLKLANDKEVIKTKITKLQSEIDMLTGQLEGLDEGASFDIAFTTTKIKTQREKEANEIQESCNKASDYLSTHCVYDIEYLTKEAERATELKGLVNAARSLAEEKAILPDLESDAQGFDDRLYLARVEPSNILKSLELPIPGLGFDEKMRLTINGRPLDNLSTEERIQAAKAIASATAGELKLICLDKLESLDSKERKAFLESIQEDDFQYFITEVTGGALTLNGKEIITSRVEEVEE